MENQKSKNFISSNQINQVNNEYYNIAEPVQQFENENESLSLPTKSTKADEEEAAQRKNLHDQIEALREKNMTEMQKNQKVVDSIKGSKDFEKKEDLASLIKTILKEMGKSSKCQIHQQRIFGKKIEGQSKIPLLNPKCRNCNKISEQFHILLDKRQSKDKKAQTIQERPQEDKLTKSYLNSNQTFPIYNYGTEKSNLGELMVKCIWQNPYYKKLQNLDFDEVLEEIKEHVKSCEAWFQNVPSTLFCCLYHIIGLRLTEKQVQRMVKFQDGPYVRVLGILFIRFVSHPEQLYDRLKQLLFDQNEIYTFGQQISTIGEFTQNLLENINYDSNLIPPRIPFLLQKSIKSKSVQIQDQRTKINQFQTHKFQINQMIKVKNQQAQIMAIHYWNPKPIKLRNKDGPDLIRTIQVKIGDSLEFASLADIELMKSRQQMRSRSRSPRGKKERESYQNKGRQGKQV